MRISKKTALAAAALLLFCANGWADTVSLPLTDDSWTDGNYPAANMGKNENLFVHNYGPKYTFVRFDAASISAQTVNNAALTLYLNDIKRSGTISVHAITSSWNEASVTWNTQPLAEGAAAAVVNLTTSDEGSVISFDVTDIVQRWANGDLPDAGFLLVTANPIRAFFDAKEKSGGTQPTLEVDIDPPGPPVFDGEAIVLDLSNHDNCEIDEPGYYVLDRSWLFSGDDGYIPNGNCYGGGGVHITTGPVTLDLRGFAIRSGDSWGSYTPVLSIDTESRVTLRNGELGSIHVAIEDSLGSDTGSITLDGIRAGGGVLLGNRTVTVTGGRFSSMFKPSLQIGADSRVTGADFRCQETPCLSARGSSLVRDCTFSAQSTGAPVVSIWGDATIFEGNVFEDWISITGNDNVVARNISEIGYFEVDGTRNVIENNIGPGITFVDSGNFFGDNRAKLPGGFSGTDGNVDWGGNVTY